MLEGLYENNSYDEVLKRSAEDKSARGDCTRKENLKEEERRRLNGCRC